MKKLTPKHVFLILVTAAIVIPLLIYGWNEIQKQPFDIVMYGAEIKADGTVIQETEFHLTGYLKAYHGAASRLTPYRILLESVTFSDSRELLQKLIQAETYLGLTGNIHAPYYTARWRTLDPDITGFGSFKLHFCNQFCCCLIQTEGRYFIGSIRQSDTIQDILALFPDAGLE